MKLVFSLPSRFQQREDFELENPFISMFPLLWLSSIKAMQAQTEGAIVPQDYGEAAG